MLSLLLRSMLLAGAALDSPWAAGFAQQPMPDRPALEVRYVDATRTAFEILAEDYHLEGALRAPHLLTDATTGDLWLSIRVEDADGNVYTTENTEEASRINLYRRGPYYHEVRWFDVQVSDAEGNLAPLRGDLALYCYPEKILASIIWHGTDDFDAAAVHIDGLHEEVFEAEAFTEGNIQAFHFPIFGEEEPLPAEALETLDADRPLEYDPIRGCYVIGSYSPGAFQEHFYEYPNYRQQVQFRVTNDDQPRRIYVMHESSTGSKGHVEGGVLLDEDGHPLPMVVQISKNFAGEREEAFYNPTDIPFSETYFPLVLAPGETRELTAQHLYQNWGRQMVKQFSSLGAWMDYFHSSTGVTETTCYVPFKFGGLSGIDIADFRAMSQDNFWGGQPQHDNIAGHTFLSYHDGEAWRYMEYRGTTYYSTGNNWFDIGLEYLSSDGKIRATVRAWETPQVDELRSFVRVEYEILEPLTIPEAHKNFRLATVRTNVQRLRYSHFEASGMDAPYVLSYDADNLTDLNVTLPRENAYINLYGENKGSNALVIQDWLVDAFDPGALVQCETSGDLRMHLVADTDTLELEAGQVLAFNGFWLPHGEVDGSLIPEREVVTYGTARPRIVEVSQGEKLTDFPALVRAEDNEAEFVIQGGRDLIPVRISGFTDYRYPRIFLEDSSGWRQLSHAREGELDGVEVYSEPGSTFGAVFLVASDDAPQRLRVTAGEAVDTSDRIVVTGQDKSVNPMQHVALIQAPWMDAPIRLRYPETVHTNTLEFIDHEIDGADLATDPTELAGAWRQDDDAGTLWFEWDVNSATIGGRLSPNEYDVDLEFWVGNRTNNPIPVGLQFCTMLGGTLFDDPDLERTWIHTGGEWVAMADTDRGEGRATLTHYPVEGNPVPQVPVDIWGVSSDVSALDAVAVTSEDGNYVFAIAWPQARSILSNAEIPCVHADPILPMCEPGKRVHQRGKVYLFEGNLDDLTHRVNREILRKY